MFAFVNSHKCLFAPKWRLFSPGRCSRLFTLKGTATWDEGSAAITGRLPLGPTVFVLLWLIGWTAGGVAISAAESTEKALLFLVFGWGLSILGVCITVRVERKSMNLMIAELEEILRD